jgi:2'-5' RNA ligase
LESAAKKFRELRHTRPFHLSFKGISAFGQKVLYSVVEEDDGRLMLLKLNGKGNKVNLIA